MVQIKNKIPDLTDYYKKEETDNKLLLKQDKLTAGENIKIENNVISATSGSGESLWKTDPNSPNIIQPKENRIITSNNTRIVYIADPEQPQDVVNLRTLDKLKSDLDTVISFKQEINDNNLQTTAKTIVEAINEINKKQPTPSIPQWKDVGTSDRETIKYELKSNTHYRIFYDVAVKRSTGLIGKYPCLISEFYWIYTDGSEWNDLSIYVPYMNNGNIMNLTINVAHKLISWKRNSNCGNFWKLQELQK